MAFISNFDLPLEPPAYGQLQKDNNKLQQQNAFLEDVIEVLSVRNKHFLTTIKRHQSHEKLLRSEIKRMVRLSKELLETHVQSCDRSQKMTEETTQAWDQFCHKKEAQMGPGARDPWDYWKNLQIRIMTKQYQDLVLHESDVPIND